MKKHLLLSLLMLASAFSATWAWDLSGLKHITDLSQIKEGGYYYIVSDRTKFNNQTGQTKAMGTYQAEYTDWLTSWGTDFVFWGTLKMANNGFIWKAEKVGDDQWAFQNQDPSITNGYNYLGHTNKFVTGTNETDMKFWNEPVGFTLTDMGDNFTFTNSEYTEPLNVHNYPTFSQRSVCATTTYNDAAATDAETYGYPSRWHLYEIISASSTLEDGKEYYIISDVKPEYHVENTGREKAISTLQGENIHFPGRRWGESYVYWGDFAPEYDGYVWVAEKNGDKWAFKNTKNNKYIGSENEPKFSETPVYFYLSDLSVNAGRFFVQYVDSENGLNLQRWTQKPSGCLNITTVTGCEGNDNQGYGNRWHFISVDDYVQSVVDANAGTNTLTNIYAATDGKNIIKGDGTCEELVLTDGVEFTSATDFTATSATYTRNAPNKWATICLPYAVSSNENVTYYTAGTINGDVLTLTSADEVPAGTPAICKFGSEGSNTITAANVNVVTGVQTESVTDDAITLIGSFTAKTIDAAATTDNVYAISGGKFVRATKKLNLSPFRAYFTTSGSTPSNGFSIAVDDDSITAINALTGEGEVTIASIYSADGKQVNDLQPGLNIVKLSNGKVQKILVR